MESGQAAFYTRWPSFAQGGARLGATGKGIRAALISETSTIHQAVYVDPCHLRQEVVKVRCGDVKVDGQEEALVQAGCWGATKFEHDEVFVFEMTVVAPLLAGRLSPSMGLAPLLSRSGDAGLGKIIGGLADLHTHDRRASTGLRIPDLDLDFVSSVQRPVARSVCPAESGYLDLPVRPA